MNNLAVSVVNAAAVNRNGIKTFLVNGLSIFFYKGNPVFSNVPKSLSRNPPDWPILCNWVFDNFISAKELSAKALQTFETCLCRKLFSALESSTNFDKILKVTSVPFFMSDFNLLIYELDNWIRFFIIKHISNHIIKNN